MAGLSPNQIQGVHMNRILVVKDLLALNILLFDIYSVDGNIVGKVARRSERMHKILCDYSDTTTINVM